MRVAIDIFVRWAETGRANDMKDLPRHQSCYPPSALLSTAAGCNNVAAGWLSPARRLMDGALRQWVAVRFCAPSHPGANEISGGGAVKFHFKPCGWCALEAAWACRSVVLPRPDIRWS